MSPTVPLKKSPRSGNASLMRSAVPRYADEDTAPMTPLRRANPAQAMQAAATMPVSPAPSGTAANPSPSTVNPVQTASPLTGLRPAYTPPGHGGINVRSYTGSRYGGGAQADPAFQPGPTTEERADAVLRQRFGAPPNERGVVDIARGGPAPIPAPVPTMAADAPQAPAPSPAPVTVPQQQPPPQTERTNPLTGDRTQQMQGTTAPISPPATDPKFQEAPSPFSARGASTPRGQDAQPGPATGGSGLYARTFASPQAKSVYEAFTKRLFGETGLV